MVVEAFAARLHEGMENCRYLEQEGRDYANSFGIGHMNGKLIAGIETGGKIRVRIWTWVERLSPTGAGRRAVPMLR